MKYGKIMPHCMAKELPTPLLVGGLSEKLPPANDMRINNVTREITSKTMSKIYSNAANTKRWLNPNRDRSRLFAFGMTKYPL